MPYPSQINAETILATARTMIEQDGIDKLSLNKLAREMGVKAPSLYRYYDGKQALLRSVNEDTIERLYGSLRPALLLDLSPFDKAMEVARRYREFAQENAAVYGMLYTNTMHDLQPDPGISSACTIPYAKLMGKLYGEQNAVAALRGFLALLHGFIMMELAEQLRRGADTAYEASVRAYLEGWQYA